MRRLLKGPVKLAWRILVLIVGSILLIAGVIMIVTPGPAVVFIPLGLGVLATEFQWARNLLQRVRPMIDAAIEKARRKRGSSTADSDLAPSAPRPESQPRESQPPETQPRETQTCEAVPSDDPQFEQRLKPGQRASSSGCSSLRSTTTDPIFADRDAVS